MGLGSLGWRQRVQRPLQGQQGANRGIFERPSREFIDPGKGDFRPAQPGYLALGNGGLPQAGPKIGDVRLKVHAASIGHKTRVMQAKNYQKNALPPAKVALY
jgi:hypothetical protein